MQRKYKFLLLVPKEALCVSFILDLRSMSSDPLTECGRAGFWYSEPSFSHPQIGKYASFGEIVVKIKGEKCNSVVYGAHVDNHNFSLLTTIKIQIAV